MATTKKTISKMMKMTRMVTVSRKMTSRPNLRSNRGKSSSDAKKNFSNSK
jgi:hypothetical protein